MKELTVEEKAQRYDEAKARMSRAFNSNRCTIGFMNEIFPELKESEDEKIKKEIINYINFAESNNLLRIDDYEKKKGWIAWLEKQSTPQVRTGLEWLNTIDDACDKRYAEEYAHGEYCHEQSFKWGFQEGVDWLEKQGEPTDINPSEFDLRLNKLLKQFETLSKEELASSLSFYLNVVQNDGTYKAEEKQGEQKVPVIDFKAKDWYVSKVDGKIRNIYHSVDKVEPKFKVGDKVISILTNNSYYITEVCNGHYLTDKGWVIMFNAQDNFELSNQKPADKVEPKFHKGEWVVYDENIYQIHNISLKQYYECLRTDGTVHIFDFEYIDSKSHLWTISDAKDGDVLATPNYIYIFNSIDKETETISFYCLIKKSDKHFSFGDYRIHDEILNSTPATQEQCDLLFKKMKEEGYKWDAEKLELKEIELKPVWNKNDENYMKSAIEMIMHCIWNSYRGLYKEDVVEWLKSLKYRFAENNEELN